MVDTTSFWLAIIGAIAYGLVQVVIAWNTSRKVTAVKEVAEVVLGHVNSAAQGYRDKIAGLELANAELRQTAVELKESAKLLAQSAAVANAQRPAPPPAR